MALDKVMIGERVRTIREEFFNESRKHFAKRCNLQERYIGQLERGEFNISLKNLDKIATATGIQTDYYLYGKREGKELGIKQSLITILDKSDKEQLELYYKLITAMISFETIKYKEK